MRRLRRHEGFTLVELVLTMTVLSILFAVTPLIFQPVLDAWSVDAPRQAETDTLSYAMSRMMDEIATVQDKTGVLTATAIRFRFNDGTGAVVDYQLNAGNLMWNNNILARNVQSLSFTYSDVNNAAIATPAVSPSETNIWMVTVEVVGQVSGQTVRLQSAIRPRNFSRS